MVCTLLAAPLLLFGQASANTVISQTQLLTSPAKLADDNFGISNAISGDNALVSSYGGVYAYEYQNSHWVETQTLDLPQSQLSGSEWGKPDIPNFYGYLPLLISGSTALVSQQISTGRQVLVFQKVNGTWQRTQVINSADPCFGTNMSMEGSTLAISAFGGLTCRGTTTVLGNLTPQFGAVYIYEPLNNVWTFKQQLSITIPGTIAAWSTEFGQAVSIDNQTMAVSSFQGVAMFAYKNSQWVEVQNIDNPAPYSGAAVNGNSSFGGTLALSGSNLFVSGNKNFGFTNVKYSIYNFKLVDGSWSMNQEIIPSAPTGFSNPLVNLGTSMAFDGVTAAFGSAGPNYPNTNCPCTTNSPLVFFQMSAGKWVQTAFLLSDSIDPHFGFNVAMSGSQLFVSGNTSYFSPNGFDPPTMPQVPGVLHIYKVSTSVPTTTTTTKKPVTTTINCYKGKLLKKVTAVKPVCPAGYKKK